MRNALLSNELCQIVVVMIFRMETNKLSSHDIIANFNTASSTKHTIVSKRCSISDLYALTNALKPSSTFDSRISAEYHLVTKLYSPL